MHLYFDLLPIFLFRVLTSESAECVLLVAEPTRWRTSPRKASTQPPWCSWYSTIWTLKWHSSLRSSWLTVATDKCSPTGRRLAKQHASLVRYFKFCWMIVHQWLLHLSKDKFSSKQHLTIIMSPPRVNPLWKTIRAQLIEYIRCYPPHLVVVSSTRNPRTRRTLPTAD